MTIARQRLLAKANQKRRELKGWSREIQRSLSVFNLGSVAEILSLQAALRARASSFLYLGEARQRCALRECGFCCGYPHGIFKDLAQGDVANNLYV